MARKLCIVCCIRKGTTANGKDFSDQCDPCHQEAGWENTHSDGDHDNILAKREALSDSGLSPKEQEEIDGCWICFPELNLAKKPAKAVAAKKVQGDRRPQLNHKGHAHPQTPKARRTCKAAFWAETPADLTDNSLAQAMAAWDAKVAPQTEAKPTKAPVYTLISTGPKHGVVQQLKATKPKKYS
jgi:hypothetical protein